MHKFILFVFSLLSVIPLAVTGNALNLTTVEKEWIKAHPHIRLASTYMWPPYEMISPDGRYEGFVADYMKLIEQRIGITFNPPPRKEWYQVLKMVKNRELDLLSCAVATPSRKEFVLFTEPYIDHPMIILTHEDVPYIHGPEALIGKTIAVEKGYANAEIIASKYPQINLKYYENTPDALKAVSQKEAYALVGNLAVTSHLIRKMGITNVKISGEIPYQVKLRMGVRDDWPQLHSILQKALDSITEEEKNRLLQKWVAIQIDKHPDYALLWKVVGFSLVIILLILYWNRKLSIENRARIKAEKELQTLIETQEICIHEEVTKNLEKDRVLVQQAKLAAMGELLSNIAHHWRQPLNGFSLNLQMLEDDLRNGELTPTQISERIGFMLEQVRNMSNLITRFSDYIGSQHTAGEHSLAETVQESVDFFHENLKNHDDVTVEVLIHENGILNGVQKNYSYALLMLLCNADDAFDQNNKPVKKITVIVEKSEDGKTCVIVSDNAGGIQEEILEKIFEPYFTTKFPSTGTGMGLFVAKTIIESQYLGKIKVNNTQEGAEFQIIV